MSDANKCRCQQAKDADQAKKHNAGNAVIAEGRIRK